MASKSRCEILLFNSIITDDLSHISIYLSCRLDDDRMLKVRPRTDGPGFLKSYITANEREVMMGFPRNYVKAPCKF